ncbi:hypothetical protein [Demequina zhanjiangensis]|uniref:Uncharacterized protein n=1 Tax=Demequina zhanjiangensis TaxID=3051659 RepID=A0ABT8G4Y6_9MICO|nr:hypothetical protein [Demequina sp. SYSU T00b26]MDN4474208.1 hypothetical protein [Demequina sp. SYSU T00b26]
MADTARRTPIAGWRALSFEERALVEAWLATWNGRTGDTATLGQDAKARPSCGCGTCPSFTVKPLVLHESGLALDEPYLGEGYAEGTDDGPGPGLLVWGLSDSLARDEIDFEIYPLDDQPVALQGLRFKFSQ